MDGDERIGLTEAVAALRSVAGFEMFTPTRTLLVPGDFATIQEAVAAASDGEAISVSAGTYTGPVSIEDKVLWLQGAGQDATVLTGGGTGAMEDPEVLILERSKVRVSGFFIRGGHRAIRASASQVRCEGTRLENNYVGILATMGTVVQLVNSQVKANGYDGVQVQRSSAADIQGCEITDNGRDGVNVFLGSSAGISGSTLFENGRRGLSVANSSSVVLTGNTVQANGDRGVACYFGSSGFLQGGNLITGNTLEGIVLGFSSSLSLGFSSPYTSGIGADTISQNLRNGIQLMYGSSLYGERGSIVGNGQNGIRVLPTCSMTMVGCDISGNAWNGVSVSQNAMADFMLPGPTQTNVTINRNGGCGVSSVEPGTVSGSANVIFGQAENANAGGNLCGPPAQ